MTEISRIDIHSHFIPDNYRRAVAAASWSDTDHFPMVPWSLDGHIANMAAHGIDASILSISDPGLRILHGGGAASELARSVNERARAIIKSHPGLFGAFALLPMPDVAAAIDEVDDALDRLGLDGIGLFTNYDGIYLGDSRFDALLSKLNERCAVVFVHPTDPPGFRELSIGLVAPALEFPFDTTRCVVSLLLASVPLHFPNIRFIFSHGGGTLPFLAARLAPFVSAKLASADPATDAEAVQCQLAAFYYDTAAVTSTPALAALKQFVPVSQLMLGFDFPFMPPAMIAPALTAMDHFDGWSAAERRQVYAGSALSVFPRLAARLKA
jgi:predicted TIM-barrel fold metal-dependent hydrolase